MMMEVGGNDNVLLRGGSGSGPTQRSDFAHNDMHRNGN